MPCDTRLDLSRKQTAPQRKEEVKKALGRLEEALTSGRVKVKIGPNGALVFDNWKRDDDRGGVSDSCAYRMLTASNSGPLRMAIAKAENLSGQKVNARTVASGMHSHDGGKTWGKD